MSTSCDTNPGPATSQPGRRRWVKVDVDDELFAVLHIRAAESRMRFLPFVRKLLKETHTCTRAEGLAGPSNAEGRSATG
jgi:hypothetical protein